MDTINFTRGVPANESFPLQEVAAAAVDALKARGAAMLQYGPSAGFQPLREWIAGWQGVALDRVLTGNGSLQLVEFLCLALLDHSRNMRGRGSRLGLGLRRRSGLGLRRWRRWRPRFGLGCFLRRAGTGGQQNRHDD